MRTWKGDILIADPESLEKRDASEIYPRRVNVKEVLITRKGEEFIFPVADGTPKLSGRDWEFREPTPRRKQTVGSADLSGNFQGESEELQPTEPTDDAEARKDLWSIQGDFFDRSHSTSCSTQCAEGRNIPYSTEVCCCDAVYPHKSGCNARKTH